MATIKNFPNNADEFIGAEYVMKWLHGRTSGVFGADQNLAVSVLGTGGMAVEVSDGLGWLANVGKDGTVFWLDNEEKEGGKLQIPISIADPVLPRITRVVVSWNTTDYADKPEIIALDGTPNSNPQPPALTNDTLKRQISLASVLVPAGATSITPENVTDERLDPEVCGLVTESLEVDTSMMQAQFAALLKLVQDELGRLNAGTEAMLKTEYDPAGLGKDVTTQVYTHSKSGTVHEFTGSGAVGRALMTADVEAGDTFQVNGTPVTAYMGTDDATGSMAGSSWNGKWISFIVEGGILNFKGGGGLSATDKEKLIPENIREGVVLWEGTAKEIVGTIIPVALFVSATATRNDWWADVKTYSDNLIVTDFMQVTPPSNAITIKKSGRYRFALFNYSNNYRATCGSRFLKNEAVVDGSEYTKGMSLTVLELDVLEGDVLNWQLYHNDNSYGSGCVMCVSVVEIS